MKLKKLIKEYGIGGIVTIKAIGNPFKFCDNLLPLK